MYREQKNPCGCTVANSAVHKSSSDYPETVDSVMKGRIKIMEVQLVSMDVQEERAFKFYIWAQ